MNKTSFLIGSSVATLVLATGAYAQSDRLSQNTGAAAPSAQEMTPSGAADRQGPPGNAGTSAAEREDSPAGGADRSMQNEPQERGSSGKKAGDTAKSDKDGSSTGAADRDTATSPDNSGKRSKDEAGKKNDDPSTGAAGNESKPAGSVTQLSGEKRTKVQSAFRSHKSDAVVKDIDISVAVGVTVPGSVSLYAVPEEVVLIVPEYRRYKYFIFDGKVVIVDPGTLAIVDILVLA